MADKKSDQFDDPHGEDVPLDARSLFGVEGKVAIVTGGSRGLGLMMARGLVANGAKVYLCSRKADACERAAAELEKRYGKGCALPLPADLSSLEGVEALVEAFRAHESMLHILVNNAGATYGAPFADYPDAAWEKVMNLNVRHVFNLTRLLTPQLQAASTQHDPARVVNIASIDGMRAFQTVGPAAAFAYTTSKGALVHMTKALCRALTSEGITVNCIAPGIFPSKMTRFMLAEESSRKAIESSNPMGRNGRTADIAATLLYLVSAGGAYTNGAIIPLDGGNHFYPPSARGSPASSPVARTESVTCPHPVQQGAPVPPGRAGATGGRTSGIPETQTSCFIPCQPRPPRLRLSDVFETSARCGAAKSGTQG